jgi:hypothetical protein
MSEGFWADPNVEPKRAYRWLLNVGGIPQWLCSKVTKPSFTVSESEVTYINHKFFYPGRVEWGEVSLTLADPVEPDASATMMQILSDSGYHLPEDPNDTSTLSKINAIQALGQVAISQIGPDGKTIEKWELINAWIKDVKFGDLDYSSDDIVNIDLTLKYDYAKQTVKGTPIASNRK